MEKELIEILNKIQLQIDHLEEIRVVRPMIHFDLTNLIQEAKAKISQ